MALAAARVGAVVLPVRSSDLPTAIGACLTRGVAMQGYKHVITEKGDAEVHARMGIRVAAGHMRRFLLPRVRRAAADDLRNPARNQVFDRAHGKHDARFPIDVILEAGDGHRALGVRIREGHERMALGILRPIAYVGSAVLDLPCALILVVRNLPIDGRASVQLWIAAQLRVGEDGSAV